MGNTFQFSKIRRKDLSSGKLFIDNSTFMDLDDDPNYQMLCGNDIGDEMDRAYYLCDILRIPGEPCELKDLYPEFADEKFSKWFSDNQCCPVSLRQAQHALHLLEDLDAMVYSMPYPKTDGEVRVGISSESCLSCNKGEHGYVEKDPGWFAKDHGIATHSYYFHGPSKDHVEILKEVAKVYGQKYYHYEFPWDHERRACPWRKGSEYIQNDIKSLIQEILADSSGEWLFCYHWW